MSAPIGQRGWMPSDSDMMELRNSDGMQDYPDFGEMTFRKFIVNNICQHIVCTFILNINTKHGHCQLLQLIFVFI